MTRKVFPANLVAKKLRFADPSAFAGHIGRFKEGEPLNVTVERRYRKRTQGAAGEPSNQNGYYWKILSIIGEEIGEDNSETVHDWVQLALGNFKAMPDGTKVPKGTRHMSVGEFAEWVDTVMRWASTPGSIVEHGIRLPTLEEYQG